MHRTVSGQPQQVHGGPRACTGVGPTCRDGKAASGLNWAGVCRLAQRRWQSRLPMAVGFEGGTHTASSPPHGDRCGRGGTSRMTIQLTQRWDCGSRDPFRSSIRTCHKMMAKIIAVTRVPSHQSCRTKISCGREIPD